MTATPTANSRRMDLPFLLILALSFVIVIFLFWLIYVKPEAQQSPDWVSFLPMFNAIMNSLCTICLLTGLVMIKKKLVAKHIICMLTALLFSLFFLASYLTYHFYHGDSKFHGTGLIRPLYFFILISHILLSICAVPMVLTTFYKALSRNWTSHRQWARCTFPVWLYVSVTGVLIFVILRAYPS